MVIIDTSVLVDFINGVDNPETDCIRNHHSLLHRDLYFDAFEERLGLRVVHP